MDAVRVRQARVALAAGLAAMLLASCGGGGGDGGSAAPGSGLLPAAPAPGATLLADATLWRPLRAGAEWQYQGVEGATGAAPRPFVATTRHALVGGALTETSDDGGISGPPEVVTLSHEGGQVRVSEPGFEGLLPAGQAFVWTELASPVRANEQRTLLDRSDADLAADIDGDGRSDRADIAAWSTVVGFEDITVPAQTAPLRALRVDVVAVARLRLTRAGVQPPERLEQSTWYAEGVGIVRRREFEPTTGRLRELQLSAWDGVTQFLGAFGPDTVAAGDPSGFYGGRLPYAHHAVRVDDGAGALLMTDSLDLTRPNRVQLARLDARGRLRALNAVTIDSAGSFFAGNRPWLLPAGSGAVVLDRNAFGPPGASFLSSFTRVYRVDGEGRPLGAADGDLWEFPGLRGGWEQAVSDGTRLWFVFLRRERVDDPTEVVVHVRGLDGRELAPAAMVLRTDANVSQLGAVATPGQGLVITAYENRGTVHRQRVLRVAAPGAMPVVRTLAEEDTAPLPPSGNPRVWPLAGDSFVALLWRGELLARNFFVAPDPRGVLLDATLAPRRSNAGALDTEALRAEWMFPLDRPVTATRGDTLLVLGHRRALTEPPFTPARSWLTTLQPAASALAPQVAARPALTLPVDPTPTQLYPFGEPTHVVPLAGGRALAIGRSFDRTTVISVAQP